MPGTARNLRSAARKLAGASASNLEATGGETLTRSSMFMKALGNENPDERTYLYSGKLILRLVFFLLRGVDETPF